MNQNTKIIPLPPVDWGGGVEKDVVLLEMITPEGITGLGSAYTDAAQLRSALQLYQDNAAMLQHANAEMTIAMSAIDIALWDIWGKEECQPISELLGGRKRDRIRAYATMNLTMMLALSGDAFEKALRDLMGRGFKAIKLSIDSFGHRDDSRSESEWDLCETTLLESARTIVGENIELMLDAYGSGPDWLPGFVWAVKTAKVLEELNYLCFEEPLAPEAFDDYARVTQRSNIAIAGGEF